MEEKWKNQALFGDVIHLIGQKLFSTIGSGIYKGQMWIDVIDKQEDFFINTITKFF